MFGWIPSCVLWSHTGPGRSGRPGGQLEGVEGTAEAVAQGLVNHFVLLNPALSGEARAHHQRLEVGAVVEWVEHLHLGVGNASPDHRFNLQWVHQPSLGTAMALIFPGCGLDKPGRNEDDRGSIKEVVRSFETM